MDYQYVCKEFSSGVSLTQFLKKLPLLILDAEGTVGQKAQS